MALAEAGVTASKTETRPPDCQDARRGLGTLGPNIEGTKREAGRPLIGLATPRTQPQRIQKTSGGDPRGDDRNTLGSARLEGPVQRAGRGHFGVQVCWQWRDSASAAVQLVLVGVPTLPDTSVQQRLLQNNTQQEALPCSVMRVSSICIERSSWKADDVVVRKVHVESKQHADMNL